MSSLIRHACSTEMEAVRALLREYAGLVGEDICFTKFEAELAELPGNYAPPAGRLLLAFEDGRLAGCAALRPLHGEICEMKRLYVRLEFRGSGLGRSLVEQVIKEADEAGYRLMRLDTLPSMPRAIQMYRALGFRQIPAYADNPASALCFELALPLALRMSGLHNEKRTRSST